MYARQASSLISGIQVGNLYEEQKVFDVVVWGKPEIRSSLTNLENMLIDTPTGQVTLGEVADVTIVPAPATIQRDTVARYVDVTANVGSGTINGVTAAIKEEDQTGGNALRTSRRAIGRIGGLRGCTATHTRLNRGGAGWCIPRHAGSLHPLEYGVGNAALAAHGIVGWCAGSPDRWRRVDAWLALWLLCTVDHCRAQRLCHNPPHEPSGI